MFSFPTTRMLKEAKDAHALKHSGVDQAQPRTGMVILAFFLVFLVSMLAQSVILSFFQIGAILSSDVFREMVASPPESYSEIMAYVAALLSSFPDWLMAVQLFSTAVTIAACLFYCRAIEKRSWVSLGFAKKGAVLEYVAGLGIGLALFGGAVAFCCATGQLTLSVTPSPAVGMIILYFFGFVVQGMSEEILCRSYLMVSMQNGCPLWVAVLTNALIFTALHIANPGVTPLALVNLTLFGIFASLYTLRRGSIWGIGAIHTVWNFAQGNIFGISVSGLSGSPSLLTATVSEGGALIHGGAFGMEGGLGVTIVLLVGCVVMMIVKTKKREIVTPALMSAT